MQTRAAALLVLLLAPVAAAGEPGPAPPALPGHRYLGRNRQGAEEWWRERDDAIVIRVPGGAFLRRQYQGTVATEEPKPVEVRSFYVDKHEVTNAQFARFLQERDAKEESPLLRRDVPGIERREGAWRSSPGMERLPVTACTGEGVMAYSRWAGARIPTSDEWMKAAGGTEGRLYPWGDSEPDATRANFGRPKLRGLEPVGSHPLGASPFGCLDMAGNAYDRVMAPTRRLRDIEDSGAMQPVMLKGGSWVSSHPLNLRVLDLCMQPYEVADRSVGFRCAMDDPEPDRKPLPAAAAPVLRLARTFEDAVAEASSRRVPIFLSLLHDTCGQCDRTIAQCYRDRRFVEYCNEKMVVVMGHQPADAEDRPHAENPDGSCTIHAGLTCREHVENYRAGLAVVGRFTTSPGNFVLDPTKAAKGAGAAAVLVPEGVLPKWGDAVDRYLAAFEEARKRMAGE